MTVERIYPDVELATLELLRPFAGDPSWVGLATPGDLSARLPFIRVAGFGGGDSDRLTDVSTLDVDVFGDGATATKLLAARIREFLTARPHVVGEVVIDRYTGSRPQRLPYGDDSIIRVSTTYRPAVRRTTIPAS